MADIALEHPVTCHALKSPLGVDVDTEEYIARCDAGTQRTTGFTDIQN